MALKFVLDKETLNKQRFTFQEGDITGTLYVNKATAGAAKEINVTVEIPAA